MTITQKESGANQRILSLSEQKLEKERLLVQSIKALNAPCWFERSCKIAEKKIFINRFIYIVKIASLGQKSSDKILNICKHLDMPHPLRNAFKGMLPNVSYVLFGYEEGQTSCGYKVYGEFNIDKKTIPTLKEPFLAAMGFKWDAMDNAKQVITHYTCFPSLSIEAVHNRMGYIFTPQHHKMTLDISKDILACVLERITLDDIFYLEAADGNNPRRSFDINVYEAGLKMKDIDPAMKKLLQHFSIPFEIYNRLYNQGADMKLGHLSGGIDREGKEFATIYGGMEKTGEK